MHTIRKGTERGSTRIGWLDSRHTFSFGDYYDPRYHNYRALRVINDDRIAPGGGFGTHPHRDMEILTYVLSGRLEHQDSMGNGEIIHAGEWQVMTAGTGIEHSEFNPSATEAVHLLQIWIMPDRKGYVPGYRQRRFTDAEKAGQWQLVASRDEKDGSLPIHQDARVSLAKLQPDQRVVYEIAQGRGTFVHVATGVATVNGHLLAAGDAIALEGEPVVDAVGRECGELLVFDLA